MQISTPKRFGFSEADASARLMRAVEKVTGAGIMTPVGGIATTKDVTDAVVEAIQSSNV
jgi:tartrate dehydrogenase/decarboxylase/D-malate dehydrogenase